MIDRSSPIPLYAQLRDTLRARIRDGSLEPGRQLQTEKEMMAQYGLSSSAVRQAVLALVQEGLIERRAGKGTFVRAQHIYLDEIDSMVSFSSQLEAQGYTPGITLVDAAFGPAADGVASMLGVPPGARVFKIVRLQRASGEPLLILTAYHPEEFGQRLQEYPNELRQPHRHRFYAEKLGVRVTSITRTFAAALATAEEAGRLGIPIAAPVLIDERVLTDRSARPFEYARAVYRGDRCRYRLHTAAGVPPLSLIEPIYDYQTRAGDRSATLATTHRNVHTAPG